MLKELPTFIDPKHLALISSHLTGGVALEQMSRLHDLLCEVTGKVYIDWLFGLDDKQRPIIKGEMKAQVSALCQRCLQPMLIPINTKTALVIFFSEPRQDEQLLPNYESIILTKTPVSLITLVEDEVILALPQIAKHDKCPSNEYQLPDMDSLETKPSKKNPFHVLSKLKSGH
ncbi:conserved hypothetical protein [Beggiatoa sp. PS]|nr:conserved hypothetical protein [Beggiatoa sp. PS]